MGKKITLFVLAMEESKDLKLEHGSQGYRDIITLHGGMWFYTAASYSEIWLKQETRHTPTDLTVLKSSYTSGLEESPEREKWKQQYSGYNLSVVGITCLRKEKQHSLMPQMQYVIIINQHF